MKYSYTAVTPGGQLTTGHLDAVSRRAAMESLQGKGVTVIRLARARQHGAHIIQIPLLQRMLLAQHLGTMLAAGVSLLEALRVIREETRSRTVRRMIDQITGRVESGRSLADSLEAQGNAFDPLSISLVRVGETSGTLEQNLSYLAEELEKRIALRSKVRSALLYPSIVIGVTIILGIVLTFFVLPRIVPLFVTLKVDLPFTTQVLLAVAQFIRRFGFLTLAFAIGLAVGLRLVLLLYPIRLRWHRLLLAVPLVGRITRAINLANFCRTLGTLVKSGVPLLEALEVTTGTLGNRAYRRELEAIRHAVAAGTSLAAGMTLHSQRQFFPPIAVSLVRVGESSGKLDSSLLYLNRFYEREIDGLMKDLTVVLEPTLLVVIGLAVAFVVSAIITPIYQITGSLRTR